MAEESKKVAVSPLQKFGLDLNTVYKKQITNFLGDEKTAMKFITSIVADVQRNPDLINCTRESLVNSYMIMAQAGFMPSHISGEAYVLPYNNSKNINGKWEKVLEAQFQIGYPGMVTLLYKAGINKIAAELVRKSDKFSIKNGDIEHEIDPFLSNEERGDVVGAYVIIYFRGEKTSKYMNIKDIIKYGQRFSKSFDPAGKYSPWNPLNDPEGWMYKKTVLKQMQKLLPKNEMINMVIAEDNKDSRISDIKDMVEESNLQMGNHLISDGQNKKDQDKVGSTEGTQSPNKGE